LVLRACSHTAFDGQVRQELIDRGATKFERMHPFSLLISVVDEIPEDPFGRTSKGRKAYWKRVRCVGDYRGFRSFRIGSQVGGKEPYFLPQIDRTDAI
jgi:hypothetical protein